MTHKSICTVCEKLGFWLVVKVGEGMCLNPFLKTLLYFLTVLNAVFVGF